MKEKGKETVSYYLVIYTVEHINICYIGLARKFIRVSSVRSDGKTEWTFWPTQCIYITHKPRVNTYTYVIYNTVNNRIIGNKMWHNRSYLINWQRRQGEKS